MFFSSRILRRQQTSTPEPPPSASPDDSPVTSERPTSSSPQQMSEPSEGYPSWLPKRPPPPAPASTFQSSVGIHSAEAGPSDPQPFSGGRKPTPRSVRIVSLQDSSYADKDRREPTDQTRVNNPTSPRVWSRATAAGMSPTAFASAVNSRTPQPKFRSTGLHLELLRNPSWKSRLYFYLYPLFVFAHIPLQTFFDFNTVFILFQVSKFPTPQAPGVPGSGRNWALGAAAYIACWAAWIIVVFLVYELIYSFARRWRIKRPLILPIYLSSSGFNFAAMSSYTNFSFLQHIRYTAFVGESGSLRDGLAETCYFYAQNLPTVALLLPRAGLALALLLTFSTPQPGVVALADAGISRRDGTFFHQNDGTLTDYARGVLLANAAWTAWRVLVLICSWLGLWLLSGHAGAGLCGPRYRWEEGDTEKRASVYSDTGDGNDGDALPWRWRECTRARVQAAHDFCVTVRVPRGKKREIEEVEVAGGFEGVEQVLAAVGFPSVPAAARRGVLSEELFAGPGLKDEEAPPELSAIFPRVVKRGSPEREGGSAPLRELPYPFAGKSAHASSEDRVPFPPSPHPSGEGVIDADAEGEGETEEDEDEDGEDEDEDGDENEDEDVEEVEESEEPSSGRASGSMSSLGQPVSSRYPFQFRHPARGHSLSSSAPSHMTPRSKDTPSSNSRSANSRVSRSTLSTGNQESIDSHSPRSHYTSDAGSPVALTGGIPMPPRHPQQAQGQARRGRVRAGTVPSSLPSSPTPVSFPRGGRPRARTRTESAASEAFGAYDPAAFESDVDESEEPVVERPESEGSHEAAEREDIVGLLSHEVGTGLSPQSSFTALRHHASSSFGAHRRRVHGSGSRSGSTSRTNSHSGSSSSSRSRTGSVSVVSARSRAQSLIQNIGAASRSSLELVQSAIRSRAQSSMARLEEDTSYYSEAHSPTHSRSGSGSDAVQSSGENYTFGQPMRTGWVREGESAGDVAGRRSPVESVTQTQPQTQLRESRSTLSVFTPSERPSERTVSPMLSQDLPTIAEPAGIPIHSPGAGGGAVLSVAGSHVSHPDISTAAQSFVTAPATQEGTTDSSGRTLSSWGGVSHMVQRPDGAPGPA